MEFFEFSDVTFLIFVFIALLLDLTEASNSPKVYCLVFLKFLNSDHIKFNIVVLKIMKEVYFWFSLRQKYIYVKKTR